MSALVRPITGPSIKQLPESERPRERLLQVGAAALSDVELVALLFGGDLGAAGELVMRTGGARGLGRALIGELCDVPRVGVARACQLVAALELGMRAIARPSDELDEPIRNALQAQAQLRELAWLEQEELYVLALDARYRLLARFAVARGTANVVHVPPRDVFRCLVRVGAFSTVVAHNHPSGDPTPSADDVDLTRRLKESGETVGVAVLDHLVIAREGCYSFTEGRLLPPMG